MNYAGRLLAVVSLLLFGLLASGCVSTENPQGWAQPVPTQGDLLLLQSKDHLTSAHLNADNTGTVNWIFPDSKLSDQKDLKLKAIYGEPVIDGDTIFLGAYSGDAFAVNRADGKMKWHLASLNGSVVGGPVVDGELLAFGTTEGRLYVVKKADGSPAPGWPLQGKVLKGGIWAEPVMANGVIYVATMEGQLYALKLSDGSDVWAKPFSASGAIAELAPLDDAHLFVPSLNKQVYIVDKKTGLAGEVVFKADDWVWTKPAYDAQQKIAYFGDFSGKVYALDITTGLAKWDFATHQRIKAAPAIVENTLVVADRKPLVSFLDRSTGASRNVVVFPAGAGTVRADVAPSEDGKSALISTTSGKLFRADGAATSLTQILVGGK